MAHTESVYGDGLPADFVPQGDFTAGMQRISVIEGDDAHLYRWFAPHEDLGDRDRRYFEQQFHAQDDVATYNKISHYLIDKTVAHLQILKDNGLAVVAADFSVASPPPLTDRPGIAAVVEKLDTSWSEMEKGDYREPGTMEPLAEYINRVITDGDDILLGDILHAAYQYSVSDIDVRSVILHDIDPRMIRIYEDDHSYSEDLLGQIKILQQRAGLHGQKLPIKRRLKRAVSRLDRAGKLAMYEHTDIE